MNVRPRTMVDRMDETMRSLASVSMASSTAPTVSQMLMEWMAEYTHTPAETSKLSGPRPMM